MNVTSKIVKGGRDTFYRSLVLSVLRQGLPPLRQGDPITLVSSARNGAGCKTFTMRALKPPKSPANNTQLFEKQIGGIARSGPTAMSCLVLCENSHLWLQSRMNGVRQCPQHQADAGLCKSNDKCFYQGPANQNATANCKRGFDGKCNWNAC
ncbi:unnamed protein product [Mytilus coruscus]|uniref:Uncharacterized protein n=1 Tax=Mytilus coruscus TaxID=42192 RepID=A0A6J8C264_MYTCO|nr:unnamed protein product [Mytilus coruscus]